MPFTLVAFAESQAALTSLGNIAAIADPHVRVSGDDVYVPRDLPNLGGCIFIGAYITQAQITSPSLRRLANIDIEPVEVGSVPGGTPNLYDIFASPRPLDPTEQLNAKVVTSAMDWSNCLAWFVSGPMTPVTGPIFTVRARASATLSPYAWTNAALVFDQTLPMGRYQVVGMRALSAGLIAARLVLTGFSWRPGCIGHQAVSDKENKVFRNGGLGVWGEFEHDTPPTVDFLSKSADTSETVYLDLIKVA
jgi:hypothetical protein